MSEVIDVVGIGNAIVDVLAHCDDAFIERIGVAKGSMTLIDSARAEELYQAMGPAIEISGGCAANTTVGVASLGGKAAFIGKVGNDQLGGIFRHDVRAAGVQYDIPPAYIVFTWGVNGYLLGREYFEMVAFRRMDHAAAHELRRRHNRTFTIAGVIIAMCLTIPFVNLLAPVLGAAFMVHVAQNVLNHSRTATQAVKPLA